MLIINDLSLRIAGRLLLDHASLTLPAGSKAGLVGRNGTGKTTLFRAITGDLSAETGSISLPKHTRIGQVAQEAPGTEEPLIDIVLKADVERAALLEEEKTATDPHRIADIHTRLADIDAHSAEARAATILAGLGFDAEAQQRPASSFSGGWRMRVALAAVLFAEPDLLLLDEPTNYLDLEGTLWLENLCRQISAHRPADQPRPRSAEPGGRLDRPSRPEEARPSGAAATTSSSASEPRSWSCRRRRRVKQEAHRKHLQSFVDRFRAKASKARQAQSRIKALEKMERIAAVTEDSVTPFSFPRTGKDRRLADHRHGKSGRRLSPRRTDPEEMSLRIDADDRIALLGANGNGKSTFAKLLSGRLKADAGTITVAPGLKVSIFAQHQLDDLRPDENAVRACASADAGRAGSQGARTRRPLRPGDREDEYTGKGSLRRREGAALDGPVRFRGAEPFHPRRADQPSRHRQPRGAGAGAERISRRRDPDQPRSPSDRSDRRSAVAGEGWRGQTL